MDGESKAAVLEEPVVRTSAVLTPNKNIGYRFVKRAFDVMASAVGLIPRAEVVTGDDGTDDDPCQGDIWQHERYGRSLPLCGF